MAGSVPPGRSTPRPIIQRWTRPVDLEEIPFAIHVSRPPYERSEPVTDLQGVAGLLRPGMVWIIPVPGPAQAATDLASWIPRLRAAHPGVPVALQVGTTGAQDSLQIGSWAGRLGIRALVAAGTDLATELRLQLCAASDLATPLVEWLGLLTPSPPSQVTKIIRDMIAGDQASSSLGDLLDHLGLRERTVRAWFAASLLPSPGQWFSLTRVLPVVMRLQREPEVPLLTAAIESGYSDHSALVATLRRRFGAAPRIIRSTIGWEWLVLRFLERNLRGAPQASGV